MITFNYIASFFLIALGFYTIITKFNIVKTVIGLSIADYGVNLLIISIGYVPGGTAPIFTNGELTALSYFASSDKVVKRVYFKTGFQVHRK